MFLSLVGFGWLLWNFFEDHTRKSPCDRRPNVWVKSFTAPMESPPAVFQFATILADTPLLLKPRKQ